ncbi:MAG: AAA family ATPase [Prevotella sp.]|nr:AAA family ATPase [Prevotella sp.]
MVERQENPALRHAWDFVEHTGRSIFLTGKAGTGKTTFLKTVVARSSKRHVVVAPTGVAAINAGGVTIHSFFQLPFSPFVPNAHVKSKFDFSKEKRRIIASLDLLIIDEISMVRSDLLDAIDHVLRRFRDHYQPFGGVQLLLIGDLQQLTPVVTPEDEQLLAPYYDTPYFFGSKALQQLDYVTIQLEKVYRQQDDTFIGLLNHIREGHPTAADLALLNSRVMPSNQTGPALPDYIRLTTHNQLADRYNENELQQLPTRSFFYRASVEGTFPEANFPTADVLELKVGAQVMFVKNDPSSKHLYYNGRIGRVVDTSATSLKVQCPGDAVPIDVEPLDWENTQYRLNPVSREIESQVLGRFRQLPLRLAWAITIHKSQGLTFEKAIIDANLSFAPGQVYVALSRCKSLEGMLLSRPIQARAILSDARVDDYISRQEAEAEKSIGRLSQLKEEYHRYLLLELFDLHSLLYAEEHAVRLMQEFFYHSYTDITRMHQQLLRDFRQGPMDVAEKWRQKIRELSVDELHSAPFLERVRRSATYFEEQLRQQFERPLQLASTIQVGNKQAMQRFSDALVDLQQTVRARCRLFGRMAALGFTIGGYLKEKQLSLLDILDEDKTKKATRRRSPRKRK